MIKEQTEIVGALITVGDEILLGDIPNGNAHFIAGLLRGKGFRLERMITVGDGELEIAAELRQAVEKHAFLIVTGGLGPTEDDRTVEAAAQAFELPLVIHSDYRQWLQQRVAAHGRRWSEELAKMTRLPAGSVKLGSEMAGFSLEHHGVPCYFLPGVPHEMRHLMDDSVLPDLEQRFPRRQFYVKQIVRVQRLVESEIQHRLRGLTFPSGSVAIGYLPQVAENWVTLLAKAETARSARDLVQQAEREVIARLGSEYISGRNAECLEQVVGRLLRERSWTMSAAESCTGGLLAERITAVAGASDYFDRGFVTYSNQAKMDLLGVADDLLREHGAVSAPVAQAMAEGARQRAKVDAAVAITGIAGPAGGSPEKPVGTVFVACATGEQTVVEKHLFSGERRQVQEKSAQAALCLLWRILCP